MDKRISSYLSSNHILTLATVSTDVPHCAICFYVYSPVNQWLIFMSDRDTLHMQQALSNPMVAGTIVNQEQNIARIQGIQFAGKLCDLSEGEKEQAEKIYFNAFPFARVKKSTIWCIELGFVKMTDNTLGFGKKLTWSSAV